MTTAQDEYVTTLDPEEPNEAVPQALSPFANVNTIGQFSKKSSGKGLLQQLFAAPGGANGIFVNDNSRVAVSITELDPNGRPKIGAASIGILNVSPNSGVNGQNGTVLVRWNVQFDHAVPLRLDFIVVNPGAIV